MANTFTPEQLLARAVQVETIAAKWSANSGYVQTLRMEAAALRFMAERQASPTELERKHEDFQHALMQGSIVDGVADGAVPRVEIRFHTKNAAQKALDTLLRLSLHGVQLPRAGGDRK